MRKFRTKEEIMKQVNEDRTYHTLALLQLIEVLCDIRDLLQITIEGEPKEPEEE